MAKECCANCTKCLKLKRHHHHDHGVEYIEYDGYICLAFASEGTAVWITELDPNEERCEEFSPKESNDPDDADWDGFADAVAFADALYNMDLR